MGGERMSKALRYFGYGSNLDPEDWSEWCVARKVSPSDIQPLFPAYLPDRTLRFTLSSTRRKGGVLDIVPMIGHVVPGMIYEVAGDGWASLAEKEGAPAQYRPLDTEVLTLDGQIHKVRSYEAVPERRRDFVPPSPGYLTIVRRGLEAHGLSVDPLERASLNLEPNSIVEDLFTYGTLMQDECRFQFIKHHIASSGTGRAEGVLLDLGPFPAMVSTPDEGTWVWGEIVRLLDIQSTLKELDRIEGFNGFGGASPLFNRRLQNLKRADGSSSCMGWVYAMDEDLRSHPVIPSGRWGDRSFLGEIGEMRNKEN